MIKLDINNVINAKINSASNREFVRSPRSIPHNYIPWWSCVPKYTHLTGPEKELKRSMCLVTMLPGLWSRGMTMCSS